jgi:hypothetical protein
MPPRGQRDDPKLPSQPVVLSTGSTAAPQSKHLTFGTLDITVLGDGRCRSACSCVCHRPRKIATPAYLNALLGHFHLRYTSAGKSGDFCNEIQCQRQRDHVARVAYKPPDWLASRILSMSLTYGNCLQMMLRMPRIVSDDAPILQFAAAGDLESIKSLLSSGTASPADVGHSYGLTALHVRSNLFTARLLCYVAFLTADRSLSLTRTFKYVDFSCNTVQTPTTKRRSDGEYFPRKPTPQLEHVVL